MVGTIRNKSTHQLIGATVVFDLADSSDSELGAVTITEANLAPGESRIFRKSIEQANATHALVREMDTK